MRRGSSLRRVCRKGAALSGVCLLLLTLSNAAAQQRIAFSPDITVILGGQTIDDEDAAHDLAGEVTSIPVGALPADADIEAYHRGGAATGHLFVLDTTVELTGGVIATPQRVIAFHEGSFSVFMDLSTCGLPGDTKIDGMTRAGSSMWFSFDTAVALGGTVYEDEDVVAVSGCSWSRILDGSAAGIPSDLDIDGLAFSPLNNVLMMSFDVAGEIDGTAFDDEDVLAYNRTSGDWGLLYDGSSAHEGWAAGDLNALDQDTVLIEGPDLEVTPQHLTFTMQQGASPESKPFTVRATEGTIPYNIQRTASWLDASPTSGESSGEADTIQAIADPGSLKPGTYFGRLAINGPGSIRASLDATLIVTGGGGGPVEPTPNPFDNGAVDAADFIPFGVTGHPMAPQSLISISGEDFVAAGEFLADSIPLPTVLGGVSVRFDGIPARLILVRPDLIIAQLPMGVEAPSATMVITNGQKAASDPQQVQVADHSPGIFTLTQNGIGQAIVSFAGTMDIAAPVGTVGNSRPAAAGDYLTAWVNGLGAVDPVIEDGHNSCEPDGVCDDDAVITLHETLLRPIVRIGGVRVPDEDVLFSGSSVASVGINEIVFRMPDSVEADDEAPITIEIGGVVSKDGTTIAVE